MSMDSCKFCGSFVDTDDDPDCYRSKKNPKNYITDWANDDAICVCWQCREEEELDENTCYAQIKQ